MVLNFYENVGIRNRDKNEGIKKTSKDNDISFGDIQTEFESKIVKMNIKRSLRCKFR